MENRGYLEHDVSVGGLKLHYQEWGDSSRPAILMVHGFGVSGHMFDEFADRMQDRYHLIAIDQRGHGDSDWSEEGDYSRDAFVGDLEGFRAAVGLDRFVLVGHSMGGLNSVAYTARFPQHVRALVLVDVGPEAAKEGVDNIMRFTRGPDELEFDQFVEMAHRFNPRRTRANIEERMRHRLRPIGDGRWTWKFDRRFRQQDGELRVGSQMSNDEMWQIYRSVPVPTLLVRGAESDVLTTDVAERAAREMRNARLVTIAGAGHSVPGDNPDDFTAAIQRFLADLDSGHFEPVAAAEPPPLATALEQQDDSSRRSLLVPLVGAAIAAVVAVATVVIVVQAVSGRRRRRRQRDVRQRVEAQARRILEPVAQVDLERARGHAVDLVNELAAIGQGGISRAQQMVRDVEFDRARAAGAHLVQAVGDTGRAAPGAVRRMEAGRLRARRRKAKKRGPSLGTALAIAGLSARLIGSRRKRARRD